MAKQYTCCMHISQFLAFSANVAVPTDRTRADKVRDLTADGAGPQASCGHSLIALPSTTGIIFGRKIVCRKDQMPCYVYMAG